MASRRKGIDAVLSGLTTGMAQWFTNAVDITVPEDAVRIVEPKFNKEAILRRAADFTEFAVNGQMIVMRVPGGRVLLTVEGDVVWVEFVPDDVWKRIRFQEFKSSEEIKLLGERMEKAPEKAGDFNEIFTGGE